MAWLVDVRIEEFSSQLVWGSAGSYPIGKQNRFEPRLKPENVPKRVILDRDVSDCAKFVLCRGGGQWIVSQRFKDTVEGLEPGIHNWLPTELVVNNTEVQKEQYYFLQHGVERDSIILERTTHSFVEKYRGGRVLVIQKGRNCRIVIDKHKTQRCHLWKEKKTTYRDIYFSDELMQQVSRLGFGDCFNPLRCSEGMPLKDFTAHRIEL